MRRSPQRVNAPDSAAGHWKRELMTKVLAYIGADPNLVAGVLHGFADAISDVEQARACGLGYEQESRMLLRKRPLGRPENVNLARQGSDLRTRAFIGHLTTARGVAPDNLPPFRWRNWLFATVGDVPAPESRAAELEIFPDFLRRNIQGHSASELMFHRFLLRLKEEAIDPAHPAVPDAEVLSALAGTLADVEADVGVVITDSRRIFAACAGASKLAWARVDGIRSWRERPLFAGHEPKRADYPHMKAVAVVDFGEVVPEPWIVVESGTCVALRAEGQVEIQKFVRN